MNQGTKLVLLSLFAMVASGCTGPDSPNHPPSFAVIHHQVFEVGGLDNRVIVVATDPDGDRLTYTMHGKLWVGTDREQAFEWERPGDPLPQGMSFATDPEKAVFSWEPMASQVGVHEVTFVVSDGQATDQEKITVEVRPSEDTGGAPEFVTPSSYVLQLVHSDTIQAMIAVRDEDSTKVEIWLEGEPDGMTFKVMGSDGKRGQFSWTPTPEQIAQKTIYTFVAHAKDDDDNESTQEIRIVIRVKDGGGPRPDCPGDVPHIDHQPLRDQAGAQDFPVTAMVTDDGRLARVFVGFTTEDPQDLRSFQIADLHPAQGDGYNYEGVIPNLLGQGEQELTYYYYLCAVDDDDPDGDECDNYWCVPEEAIYSFVARPRAQGTCADDAQEPNPDRASAREVEPGELPNLWLCPGDEDWFSVSGHGGDLLEASILFSSGRGDLGLEVWSPSGEVLGRSDTQSDREEVEARFPGDGPLLLRVFGDLPGGGDGNGYMMQVSVQRGAGCRPDQAEPNDDQARATPIGPGDHGPFTICEGDRDFYALQVSEGDELTVDVLFSHRDGDLDAVLAWEDGATLRTSTSSTDDEHLVWRADRTGTAYVAVVGWEGATNQYRLSVAVASSGQCPDHALEPNDDQARATPLGGEPIQAAICPMAQGEPDVDVFSLELPALTTLYVDLTFDNEAGDLDVAIGDSHGMVVGFGDSSDDDEHAVVAGLLDPGPVYVYVYGYQGATNTYTLSRRTESFPGEGCPADWAEPNDQRAEAAGLEPMENGEFLARGLSACGDDDWFSLTVPQGAGSLLAFVTYPEGRGGDLELEVYQGEALLGSGQGSGGEAMVDAAGLGEGPVFLRVVGRGPLVYELDAMIE